MEAIIVVRLVGANLLAGPVGPPKADPDLPPTSDRHPRLNLTLQLLLLESALLFMPSIWAQVQRLLDHRIFQPALIV